LKDTLPAITLAGRSAGRTGKLRSIRGDAISHKAMYSKQLERPIGVVFGGGGFKGAAHTGFVKPLQERGIPIDLVCGVSVGALTAALVAQHDIPLLNELWDFIENEGSKAIFQRWPFYKLLSKLHSIRTSVSAI